MSNRVAKPCAQGNEVAGAVNAYACSDRHATFTINGDQGVTPARLPCPYPNCALTAHSQFYKLPDGYRPEMVVLEWYRPSASWARRRGLAMVEHVRKGGLVLRHLTYAVAQRYGVGDAAPRAES